MQDEGGNTDSERESAVWVGRTPRVRPVDAVYRIHTLTRTPVRGQRCGAWLRHTSPTGV
ncbi:MAG: hypothetical protein J0M33_28895 [Anaerolineae bacterium]|nr:hypothetical protein [Anaerolineae bacterium]